MRAQAIVILGAGAWGTALANAAARAGREVLLWGRDRAAMAAMAARRENARHLPGIVLEPAVRPVADEAALAAGDVVILAVPTQQLGMAARALSAHVRPGQPVISAAKGIERETGRFVTEILAEALPQAKPAILSGPSFAADVAAGLPTAVTLAATEEGLARALAEALSSARFRLYHSTDVRGVEIGGATKNVLAIAAGIVAGRQLGASAAAALTARGFAELIRFGQHFGARAETLTGLSGLGDLILTCGGPQSRNFAFGQALGEGKPPLSTLAEGAFTAPVLAAMAAQAGLDMPIASAVAAILAGTMTVDAAIAGLLSRPVRGE